MVPTKNQYNLSDEKTETMYVQDILLKRTNTVYKHMIPFILMLPPILLAFLIPTYSDIFLKALPLGMFGTGLWTAFDAISSTPKAITKLREAGISESYILEFKHRAKIANIFVLAFSACLCFFAFWAFFQFFQHI